MIFVTVGTHEQPFDRLIQAVDELVRDKVILDEVFMQIGYSTYEPKYTKWSKVITYNEMAHYEDKADIIITHGGPATFMSALSKGKVPIVVPRLEKYGEHINDHQLDFAKKVKNRGYEIKIVYEIDQIRSLMLNYTSKAATVNESQNEKFVNQLEFQIKELLD